MAGTAWLIGLLHGLRRAGVDLAEVDTIVGTSAGAIAVVALTSGRDLGDLATRAAQPESGADPQAMALARAARDEPEDTRRDEVRRQIGRLAVAAAGPASLHVDRIPGEQISEGVAGHEEPGTKNWAPSASPTDKPSRL
ncbi:hypothetical protein ACQPXH_08975 [Nocardia sp. CA-135953]|uniref:hypothetical protein n=1 Tax=Nocardia sp. CA-135953 TaxID=3239978 RepID=UPI003D98BC88